MIAKQIKDCVTHVKQLLDENRSSYVFDKFNLSSVRPLAFKSSETLFETFKREWFCNMRYISVFGYV